MQRLIPSFVLATLALACSNPAAEDTPEGTVDEAKPVTPPPKQSDVSFDATSSSIRWVGAKVTRQHEGGFERFTGTIKLGPEDGIVGGSVRLDIDATSIYSDTDKLTDHLRSDDFFAVDQFPTAHFVSTKIEPHPGEGATHAVTGNLTLRGVTKSVTFPAKITVSGAAVTAQAEFTINRKDWNIVYPGAPDNLISDDVVIRLSVAAPRS